MTVSLAHAAHAQHCCGAPGSLLAHLVVSPCRTNLGAMTSSHLTFYLMVIYLRANHGTGHLAWGVICLRSISHGTDERNASCAS
jgi:hypothetical protein